MHAIENESVSLRRLWWECQLRLCFVLVPHPHYVPDNASGVACRDICIVGSDEHIGNMWAVHQDSVTSCGCRRSTVNICCRSGQRGVVLTGNFRRPASSVYLGSAPFDRPLGLTRPWLVNVLTVALDCADGLLRFRGEVA